MQILRATGFLAVALSLSACGGGDMNANSLSANGNSANGSTAMPSGYGASMPMTQNAMLRKTQANTPSGEESKLAPRQKTAGTSVGDYQTVVEQLFIAYFGRPVAPGGLSSYGVALLSAGAPTDIVSMYADYGSNQALQNIVNTFGTSAESVGLYGSGTTQQFVTAIFQNVLGRAPNPAPGAGLETWSTAIDSGTVTQAEAALAIMASAAGQVGTTDSQLVANRLSVAIYFTNQLQSNAGATTGYANDSAHASLRNLLGTVSASTDAVAFESTVNSTVANLAATAFAPIQAIITQRCVPCHSSHPTEPGYSSAPLGYMFDTSGEIHSNSDLIYQVVVLGRPLSMPYGNATGMTSAERTTIANWYAAGAY